METMERTDEATEEADQTTAMPAVAVSIPAADCHAEAAPSQAMPSAGYDSVWWHLQD